jgi:hypothetical protein
MANGNVFVTLQGSGVFGTNGVYSLDRSTGVFTPILQGSQTTDGFIPNFPNHVAVIPEPAGALALLVMGAGLSGMRRRVW